MSRFETELHVRILNKAGEPRYSCGVTVNLSEGGVLVCDAIEGASPGTPVELAIQWPVRLGEVCPLRLLVNGRVLRREGRLFVLQTENYEFRTYGSRAFHDSDETPRVQFYG